MIHLELANFLQQPIYLTKFAQKKVVESGTNYGSFSLASFAIEDTTQTLTTCPSNKACMKRKWIKMALTMVHLKLINFSIKDMIQTSTNNLFNKACKKIKW